jgi:hypothetical protein
MLHVFAALGFTAFANVEANGGKLGKRRCALRGEGDHRTANRQHLVRGFGACTHGLVVYSWNLPVVCVAQQKPDISES